MKNLSRTSWFLPILVISFTSIILNIIFNIESSHSQSINVEGDRTFKKYFRMMRETPDGVIKLKDKTFRELILAPGARRSFPTIIFFTAGNPRFGCGICGVALDAFKSLAKSYVIQKSRAPDDKGLLPTVFATLDLDDGGETFDAMKMMTVPHTYFFPANERVTFPMAADKELFFQPDDMEILYEALEARTGLKLRPLPDARFTIQGGFFLALMIALAFYLVNDQWELASKIHHNRYIWLTMSYVIFASAVGGMVYCIIRSPPPFILGRDGLQLFALRSQQEQFVMEGAIVGGLNLLCGLSFLLAYYFASSKRYGIVRFLGVNMSLALAIYLFLQIFSLYCTKTRWYDVQATLDPSASDFFFGNVKKSSGLLKRLIRITRIFVFEYTDFPSFKKSFKGMIINYIKRSFIKITGSKVK